MRQNWIECCGHEKKRLSEEPEPLSISSVIHIDMNTLTTIGNNQLISEKYCVLTLGQLDLNINAARKFQLGERIHRFLGGRVNFNQALVGAQLELLTSFFIHVR